MDQKRTVWIVIAAGVFLLVVVGAALILNAPAANRETRVETMDGKTVQMASSTVPATPTDSFAQGTSSTAEQVTPSNTNEAADGTVQTDNLTVISNGTTNVIGLGETTATSGTTTIDLNTLKSTPPATVTANNTVAENAIKETAEAHTTSVEATKETVSTKASSPSEKTTAKATSTSTSSPSASSSKKAGTSTKNTPTVKVADKFWVQAASYSTKKNADEARAMLDTNKIQSEVFTYKDSSGKMFYRVRVGPYTTKSEAEYWQGRIEAIDLFAHAGSYITNSSAAKK